MRRANLRPAQAVLLGCKIILLALQSCHRLSTSAPSHPGCSLTNACTHGWSRCKKRGNNNGANTQRGWIRSVNASNATTQTFSLVLRGGGNGEEAVRSESDVGQDRETFQYEGNAFAGIGVKDARRSRAFWNEITRAMQDGEERGVTDEQLQATIERIFVTHFLFENVSIADDFITALTRQMLGFPVKSANWTCAACSAVSESHMLGCTGCGMQRSVVEYVQPAKHLDIDVPSGVPSLELALQQAQDGLRRGWNAAGRSARISVSSGSHTWAKELLVLCNMTLSLVGEGFQGCQGGRSLGRWWCLEGSQGRGEEMHFEYTHPHRSPARDGVPKCHLEPTTSYEEAVAFFEGRHPEFELDEEWDLVWATIDCWGGPWHFEACSILASEAIAFSSAAAASSTLCACRIGGIDEDGERALQCVDLSEGARCQLDYCDLVNGAAAAAALACKDQARGSLLRCFVRHVDFGLAVDGSAAVEARDSVFHNCVWATILLGLFPEGTSVTFCNNTVIGPGWADERRPPQLLEEDNVMDTLYKEYRPWQNRSDERARQGIFQNEILDRVRALGRRSVVEGDGKEGVRSVGEGEEEATREDEWRRRRRELQRMRREFGFEDTDDKIFD